MNGTGLVLFSDGKEFMGQFQGDRVMGKGKLRNSDGSSMIGRFQESGGYEIFSGVNIRSDGVIE